MVDAPELLLANHLKTLRLPTFLREHDKLARICAAEGIVHVRYVARLTELELIDRERRMVERQIKSAKFPAVKSALERACYLRAPRLKARHPVADFCSAPLTGFTPPLTVKQLLSINDPAVKFLIDAGYLKATVSHDPAKRLAEMQGTTPRSVIARMRKLGVAPIEMPDGRVGTIYETEKIQTVMLI